MWSMERVRRRLRLLARRAEVDRELDEELRFHLEMEVEDRIRSGMAPAEARRTALRDFGGVDRYKEEVRDVRGLRWYDDVVQDARVGLRGLRRNPAFAVVALVTLAVGIGVNTAIFSVVHGTLLRGLPYVQADRLVALWERSETGGRWHVTGPNYEDWRELSRSFDAVAVHSSPQFSGRQTILGADVPVRAQVTVVSEDFFRVLGVAPAVGRGFTAEERTAGGPGAALVSHAFWQEYLGGDPGALGRQVGGGQPFEIVGILPPGFGYPAGTDIWISAEGLGGVGAHRTAHNWEAIARLAPGVTAAEAEAELTRITELLRAEHGDAMSAHGARVVALEEQLVGGLRTPLLLLLAAAGLVLLVACTNLASGYLARGAARGHEVAIRTSLGADRPRLLRQLFTESLVVSMVGALLGLALALVLLRGIPALAPAEVARTAAGGLDGWVLAFTLVLAVVSAIGFGLLPALRTSTTQPAAALRGAGRGLTGSRQRVWNVLVGLQAALAVLLLIGSVLLIQSLRQVLGTDRGFAAEQVLTMEVSLPPARYADDAAIAGFHQRLREELAALPGVAHVGLIQHLPLGGQSYSGIFEIEERGSSELPADYRIAGGDYLQALEIPLLRGRFFAPGDDAGSPDVAVINRALAERLWPEEDPVGKRVRNLANDSWVYPDRWLTIVGVIGDVRHEGLLTEPRPEIYVHYLQRPARAASAVFVLRASTPPGRLAPAARARVAALDPDVPATFATMQARVLDAVADRRFAALVLAGFALVALLLAAVGIYGVVSYSVERRTREIGIRLALGGEPAAVRALVQRHALAVALAGIVAGAGGALLLSRFLRGLLHGVSPTDPAIFVGSALALAAVAWLASYVPARRTTRVDPMSALRSE
jgi:putative ABC transport system permease protein